MGKTFNKIYEIVILIPKGKVATYGQVAKLAGMPRSAKIVGYALHSNPMFGVIPCHRVVNRLGELSGAFAFGGENVQRELLTNEGVEVINGKVNLQKFLWEPTN